MKKVGFISGGIVLVLGAFVLFTFIVMWLWNWLMPVIFDLGMITFWQAAGIIILSKIIFCGCGHGHKCTSSYKRKSWHEKFRSKWECIPQDKKEEFQSKMKEKGYSDMEENKE